MILFWQFLIFLLFLLFLFFSFHFPYIFLVLTFTLIIPAPYLMYLLYILEPSIEFISRSGDGCFIVYEYSWEWLCYLYFCQGNTVVAHSCSYDWTISNSNSFKNSMVLLTLFVNIKYYHWRPWHNT